MLKSEPIATRAPSTSTRDNPLCKVLAVASGGGHWVQLLRLMPAFRGCEVVFVTVDESYRAQVAPHRCHIINDATRWDRLALLRAAVRVTWLLLRERPDVVVSTGAAPGFFALLMGKRLLGARTIWVDSIANVERLSMSGQKIGKHADLWLTQWPHLSTPQGPRFGGAVL